jgi:hypothetical protein
VRGYGESGGRPQHRLRLSSNKFAQQVVGIEGDLIAPAKGVPSVPASTSRPHPSLPITEIVKQGRIAETGMLNLARPTSRSNQSQ